MYLAYLDPGSGSMLAAAVVAGVAGVAVTARIWWRKGMAKLRRQPAGDSGPPTDGDTTPPADQAPGAGVPTQETRSDAGAPASQAQDR